MTASTCVGHIAVNDRRVMLNWKVGDKGDKGAVHESERFDSYHSYSALNSFACHDSFGVTHQIF